MSVQKVRQGEITIARETGSILEARSLGATLAVCLSDPSTGISAAAVFVVPGKTEGIKIPEDMTAVSVTSGLPMLFRQFMEAGASKAGMKIWFAGCGRFMESPPEFDLGLKLYSMAKKIIEKNGLKIAGEHVGGALNRSVTIEAGSDHITVRLADNTEVTL
jgi:chemotaxis receptor (MCP) glutamine deamidase CheD